MNVHANDPLAVVPGFLDLVFHPLTARCRRADQHDFARLSPHLLRDPILDRLLATAGNILPVVVAEQLVALQSAHLANLRRSPVVRLVVEAVEDCSSHRGAPSLICQGLQRTAIRIVLAFSQNGGSSSSRSRGAGGVSPGSSSNCCLLYTSP